MLDIAMGTIEEITLLYEISKALDVSRNLRESLYKVLDILARSTEMERGTITIMNPVRDEVRIEVAHGLSRTAIKRGKYKAGEGITGKVIETGKSFIVPKVSEEPLFLNRTATRRSVIDQEISFICVPVKKGNKVVGTLSVDIPFDESYLLKEGERLLSIVAAMIAQHVINLETIQMEKQQLRKENNDPASRCFRC